MSAITDWTDLLKESLKLSRDDKLKLVKAIAGNAGMIACFPNQMVGNTNINAQQQPKGQPRSIKKTRKVQEAKAPNPLHGTEIAKAFSAAKKSVRTAKKAGTVEPDLVESLEKTKKDYFEALTKAKADQADTPS